MDMKTKALLLVVLLVAGIMYLPARDIKGNGNIVTRTISIKDYDQIELSSWNISYPKSGAFSIFRSDDDNAELALNYRQQPGEATLKITIDENLVSSFGFEVEGRKLIIKVKEKNPIVPTRMKINTTSSDIKKLELQGSLDMYVRGTVRTDDIELSLTGSGDIKVDDPLEANRISAYVKGSGDVVVSRLSCNELQGKVAGSGDLTLRGKADRGYYEVAGSGDLSAYDCTVTDLECLVKGSGDIRAYATGTLNAEVRGSGDIGYKGDAQVKAVIKGSGDITKR